MNANDIAICFRCGATYSGSTKVCQKCGNPIRPAGSLPGGGFREEELKSRIAPAREVPNRSADAKDLPPRFVSRPPLLTWRNAFRFVFWLIANVSFGIAILAAGAIFLLVISERRLVDQDDGMRRGMQALLLILGLVLSLGVGSISSLIVWALSKR